MFKEMDKNELMETNGGAFPWIPVIVLVVLLSGSLSSCSNSCDQ